MKPFRDPKKFAKKLFSVSEAVSASLLRDISSTVCIIDPTTDGSLARTQIVPTLPSPSPNWASIA